MWLTVLRHGQLCLGVVERKLGRGTRDLLLIYYWVETLRRNDSSGFGLSAARIPRVLLAQSE